MLRQARAITASMEDGAKETRLPKMRTCKFFLSTAVDSARQSLVAITAVILAATPSPIPIPPSAGGVCGCVQWGGGTLPEERRKARRFFYFKKNSGQGRTPPGLGIGGGRAVSVIWMDDGWILSARPASRRWTVRGIQSSYVLCGDYSSEAWSSSSYIALPRTICNQGGGGAKAGHTQHDSGGQSYTIHSIHNDRRAAPDTMRGVYVEVIGAFVFKREGPPANPPAPPWAKTHDGKKNHDNLDQHQSQIDGLIVTVTHPGVRSAPAPTDSLLGGLLELLEQVLGDVVIGPAVVHILRVVVRDPPSREQDATGGGSGDRGKGVGGREREEARESDKRRAQTDWRYRRRRRRRACCQSNVAHL